MVGALPFEVEMEPRPQGHGYAAAEVKAPNPFFPVGSQLRGHEFHHSRLRQIPAASQHPVYPAYRLLRGSGLSGSRAGGEPEDGLVYRNVLASYIHLHAGGSPDWAPGLVQRARAWEAVR
jgi:cobyrinic acid a,c-diamide synthase